MVSLLSNCLNYIFNRLLFFSRILHRFFRLYVEDDFFVFLYIYRTRVCEAKKDSLISCSLRGAVRALSSPISSNSGWSLDDF